MQDKTIHNPYQILGVSRLASDAEITKAFSQAMKARKYPPDAIARARKSLMNPNERMMADYLSPNIPPIKRFRNSLAYQPEADLEDGIEQRLNSEQIERLIKTEIDKLARSEIFPDPNFPNVTIGERELANLIWES
jgi:curved DNA-binding protein CbpA